MSKKFKLFVTISILLNFIFLGLVFGRVFHHFNKKPHGHFINYKIIRFLDKTSLSEAQKQSFKARFEDSVPKFDVKDEGEEELVKILTAKNFDAVAFARQIEKRHNHFESNRKEMTQAMIDLAKNLNIEERKKLSKILSDKKRHP